MAKYATEDNLIRYTNALKANATILNRKTAYAVGDVVQKGNVFLKCITAGITATTALTLSSVINTILTDGTVTWQVIDPFAETKIRDWESGVKYEVSRIVKYNGSLYRCLTTNMDATFTIANWELLVTGITDWVSGENYVVGQFVVYNGVLYECITANNDSTFNSTNWQKIAGGGLYTWVANTSYSVGDVVIYNNNIYQCNTTHTSGSAFNPDASKWTEISACITRIPNWQTSTDYVVGDLVAHDAKIYRCTTSHRSDSTQWNSTEEANWEELSPTINEISMWAVSTNYAVGQLVIHNNKLYRCNTAHTSDSTSFNTDIAYWDEIGSSGGIESWRANELYTQGNMVVYNDKIYICDISHTSTSTFDPTKWHEISSNDIDSWQASTIYKVGDIVVKDGQLYRCITQHTSDSSDFSNDIANWQTLDTKWKSVDWAANTLYIAGEVVLYNNTPIKCTTTHVSDTTYELDKDNWETLSANIREWVSGNTYKVGDTVIYENEIWKCITANNSNSFEKGKWRQVNKCNIEIWHGAPDPNILALLHFDNQSNPYYNEYGDRFTYNGSGGSTYLNLINSASGVDIPVIGGIGYCLNTNSFGSIISPDYDFTLGTEVYTIEFFSTLPNGNDNTTLWSIGGIGIGARNDAGVGPDIFHNVVDIGGISQLTTISSLSIDTSIYWHHFAYILSATECTLFIDGVNVKSFIRANSDPVSFISEHGNSGTSGVFIDELMVTNGAKYVSNFTPPSVPFNNPNFDGYKVNDLVVYNDKIYRCITVNNDVVFTPSKWVEVSPYVSVDLPEWQPNTSYTAGKYLVHEGTVYKVVNDFTSGTTFNDTDLDAYIAQIMKGATSSSDGEPGIVLKPTITDVNKFLKGDGTWGDAGGGIAEYTTGTSYSSGDLVIKDNVLYKANTTTSTTWVDSEWDIIGTTFNTTSAYAQKIVTNVVAPYEMLLQVGDSNYCKPPIDVLKKTGGSSGTALTLEDYNNPSAYTGTSDFLKIANSKAKLYNYKEYQITPQTLSTIDIGVSDEIDFDEFVDIGAYPDEYTKLLLQFNGTIEDVIGNIPTGSFITVGTLTYDTGKFGQCLANNCAVRCNDTTNMYQFGSGDWTIDYWVYTSASNNATGIEFTGNDRPPGINDYVLVASIGFIRINGQTLRNSTDYQSLPEGFHHVAVVRNGNNIYEYIDGSLVWSTSWTASIWTYSWFNIGFDGWGQAVYGTKIDEFRISNIARWTSDFTPPSQPYYSHQYNISSLEVV